MLAAVVGVALAGGSTPESPGDAAVPSPASAASAATAATTPAASLTGARPTVDPARPRGLVVRGWVARRIGDLHVMVTSATFEPIAISAIDPTGMPRNGMVPFEATFRLPRAVAETEDVLFVVAVDGTGFPIARAATRRVEGPIVELVVR